MATNASTWFYAEPEHRAYLIEERVNHTFWGNRITSVYLDCVREESPFQMTGEWNSTPITLEWVPNDYLTLLADPGAGLDPLIVAMKEILGFLPTISYINLDGHQIVEWRVKGAEQRVQEIQGNAAYRNVKRYKS